MCIRDSWQGANFKLKIVKKDGYWNYDKSEFDKVSPLLEDDDALEALWKKQYSLAAVTAADLFNSYDDLKKRLDYVLGAKKPARRIDEEVFEEDNNRSFQPKFERKEPVAAAPVASASSEEDDALSYFQKLAEE